MAKDICAKDLADAGLFAVGELPDCGAPHRLELVLGMRDGVDPVHGKRAEAAEPVDAGEGAHTGIEDGGVELGEAAVQVPGEGDDGAKVRQVDLGCGEADSERCGESSVVECCQVLNEVRERRGALTARARGEDDGEGFRFRMGSEEVCAETLDD